MNWPEEELIYQKAFYLIDNPDSTPLNDRKMSEEDAIASFKEAMS